MAPGRSPQDDARRRSQPARNRVPGSSQGARAPRGTGRPTTAGRPGAGRTQPQRAAGTARPTPSSRTAGRPSQGRRPAMRSQTRPVSRRGRPPRPRRARPRYWLRRLIALIIAIALLVALSYGIIAAASWVRDTIRAQDARQAARAVSSPYPDPVACPAAQVEVAMSTPTMVAVGAGLSIAVTLTNTGAEDCLLDVGAANLGTVITSGGVRQWSSLTCPAEPAQRMLLVRAGDSATTTLTWDGRVGAGQCSATTADGTGAQDGSAEPTEAAQDGSAEPTEAAQDGSAEPTEAAQDGTEAEGEEGTPAPDADRPVATEGTYILHLEMGGTVVTEDRVFIIG
ncbi:hypothetical protein [Actinomyces sp. W5033]|uniref:hypothetical protein n=1 Tax=Actinomyces sp. W5033 TaxID=3446479 RepID=UPI003EDF3D2C